MAERMIDAVVSVHLNPLTSGVAKFNALLADHLHVDLIQYGRLSQHQHPLVSVKCSEVAEANALAPHAVYSLFLHDWGGSFRDVAAVQNAVQVYAANRVIAQAVGAIRRDVITTHCPSTVMGDPTRGHIHVLSFGMAHKFQGVHFERLKLLLDLEGSSYTVGVSTGIHEGSPWAPTFTENLTLMRGIFGPHLRALGFLGDDALAKELRDATAVALFFEPAARANNTSLWAALDAGALVITNLDHESPADLRHGQQVLALSQLIEWPNSLLQRKIRSHTQHPYSWAALVDQMTSRVSA